MKDRVYPSGVFAPPPHSALNVQFKLQMHSASTNTKDATKADKAMGDHPTATADARTSRGRTVCSSYVS